MKNLIRSYLINLAAIYITSIVTPGLSHNNDLKVLLLAAFAFGLVNMFAKPFVKIIFLPVNILTLGLFSWVVNVILLYLTTLAVSNFEIKAFDFPGFSSWGFVIPAMKLSKVYSAVISSFIISFISRFLYWIVK